MEKEKMFGTNQTWLKKHFAFIMIVLIYILTIGVALLLYYMNFHALTASQTSYGTFGDYLNPFFSFLNLIVLIWLTLKVEKNTAARSKMELASQKKHLSTANGKMLLKIFSKSGKG